MKKEFEAWTAAELYEKMRQSEEKLLVGKYQLIKELEILKRQYGSYAAIARKLKVSDEFVRSIANGRLPPTGKVLKFLGYEKVVRYRKIGKRK